MHCAPAFGGTFHARSAIFTRVVLWSGKVTFEVSAFDFRLCLWWFRRFWDLDVEGVRSTASVEEANCRDRFLVVTPLACVLFAELLVGASACCRKCQFFSAADSSS
jgi:hypothetical protein